MRLEEIFHKQDGLKALLLLQSASRNVTRTQNAVVLNGTIAGGTDPSATCCSLGGDPTKHLVDKPKAEDGKTPCAMLRMIALLPTPSK
jgi:hypothetical protein